MSTFNFYNVSAHTVSEAVNTVWIHAYRSYKSENNMEEPQATIY